MASSNPIALGGNMPADDFNGWMEIYPELVGSRKQRKELRYAVIAFDVNEVKEKTATWARVAVLQIKHVEVVKGDDKHAVEAIINRRFEERTGHAPQQTLESIERLDGNIQPSLLADESLLAADEAAADDSDVEEDALKEPGEDAWANSDAPAK